MLKQKQLTCRIKAIETDNSEWELVFEALASTPDVDRANEITLPTAFAETMPKFMQNPVMMFNHQSDWTIGKVLDYEVRENGLWVKCGIVRTERGKDVATLIRSGVVSTMSFMYEVLEAEWSTEKGVPSILKKVEVYEIGPVSIPANTAAIIQQAKEKNLILKSLPTTIEAGVKVERITQMEPKEVQTVVDSTVTPVKEELSATKTMVDATKATVEELNQKLIADMANIENQLKDAVSNGRKSDADIKSLVERASGDVAKVLKEMDEMKAKIAQGKRGAILAGGLPSMDVKALVGVEPSVLEHRYGDGARPVKEFQRLNDQLLIVDAMQMAKCENARERVAMSPEERYKRYSPKTWGQLQELAKAMDTATSNEGSQFIPTGFSGNLVELIRADLKVATLFDDWTMLKSPDTIPVEGADVEATLAGQTKAVISAFDSTEQTPGTAQAVFTASKARARIQVSAELDEDSAINMAEYTKKYAVRSIVRAVDRAVINGDNGTTHFDTGYTVAATEFRRAWDGLRYHYQTTLRSTHGQDLSTFNAEGFRKIRGEMGVFGMYPSQLAALCSIKTYLQKFLKDIPEVQTLKDYGPKATILTGELANVDGVPLVISEFVSDIENAVGIYDGITVNRGEVLMVNTKAWMMGNYRGVQLEVVPDVINDVYTVVAFRRCSFMPLFTPTATTGVIVNGGYNVTF